MTEAPSYRAYVVALIQKSWPSALPMASSSPGWRCRGGRLN